MKTLRLGPLQISALEIEEPAARLEIEDDPETARGLRAIVDGLDLAAGTLTVSDADAESVWSVLTHLANVNDHQARHDRDPEMRAHARKAEAALSRLAARVW